MVRTKVSTAVLFASTLAAALTLASATNSFAAQGGMGGGGGKSGTHGNFGGNSASHISAQGLAHTNGPNATDRDFGRARAQDVRSSHAQAHSRSHTHVHATSHRTAGRMAPSKWDTLTSL